MTPAVSHAFLHRATEPEANAVKSIPDCHTIDNGAGEPLRRKGSDIYGIADASDLLATSQHVVQSHYAIAVGVLDAAHLGC